MKRYTILLFCLILFIPYSCHKRLDIYPSYDKNSRLVGPEGKRIEFENASIIIDIPAGALDTEVEISISRKPGNGVILYDSLNYLYYTGKSNSEIWEISPAGLIFKKNITIQFLTKNNYKKVFRKVPGADLSNPGNWSETNIAYSKTAIDNVSDQYIFTDKFCTAYLISSGGSRTGFYLDGDEYNKNNKEGLTFFEGYYWNQYEQDIEQFASNATYPLNTIIAFAETPIIGKTYSVYNTAAYGQLSLDSINSSEIYSEQGCFNGNCSDLCLGVSGEVKCLYLVNEYGTENKFLFLKNVILENSVTGERKRMNGYLNY